MVFACQIDSFQRTLTSVVKSCNKISEDGNGLYEVICEDSILFPEGGGQPWDKGFINDIPVQKVLRKLDEAVMYIEKPLQVGEKVVQVVDWERRFDHMQQHSGQHLITAVINSEYKIDTTSWWLGEKVSHIELNVNNLTDEQISRIEELVNEKILERVPVVAKLYELGDKALDNARTRGLPDDVTGPIRVVEIVGLEDDLCCGTHVTNLCQLQCIKLLQAEKGKKGKVNLFFLAGGRVLKYFSECLKREKKMTELLKNEPAQHFDLVKKLQLNHKISNKKLATAFKELATFEAKKFKDLKEKPQYFCLYNKDAELGFVDCFCRTLKDDECINNTVFILACGEEKGIGNLVVYGNENDVKLLGPKLADLLDGKGTAVGNKFQAKVSSLCNFKKAENAVKEYFQKKSKK